MREDKRQDDGLARTSGYAQATTVTQAAIEFECGVVEPPCLSRADLDASAAGGGLDGGMHAARTIEFRQLDLPNRCHANY
jgi:hypothetical protein